MKRCICVLTILLFFTVRSEVFPESYETCPVPHVALTSLPSHADNHQRLIAYFTPYLDVLALRFFSTVAHELGHAVSYWAIAKKWPNIVVGNNEDKKRLVFDAQKFKLFLPNADTMYFCGSIDQSQTIINPYLDVFNSLMGPIFGALFSYGMLQYVQQSLVRYAAHAELFEELLHGLITKGDTSDESDGYLALKALQLPTSWMQDFERNELDIADSIFDFLNLPQLIDLLMFCKLFQARSDNERIIMLGGQMFFMVMIPYVINSIKELYQKSVDFARENIDQAEKIVQKSDNFTLFFAFSRFWLLTVMPVLFMHQLIKLNARLPVKDYMTDYF